ncbi:hypothetical protein CBS101457_002602 [Exobasidium rhododendri]|nr:hypothetical protein CBS101457_002602 [Exobasidium rhododendri]
MRHSAIVVIFVALLAASALTLEITSGRHGLVDLTVGSHYEEQFEPKCLLGGDLVVCPPTTLKTRDETALDSVPLVEEDAVLGEEATNEQTLSRRHSYYPPGSCHYDDSNTLDQGDESKCLKKCHPATLDKHRSCTPPTDLSSVISLKVGECLDVCLLSGNCPEAYPCRYGGDLLGTLLDISLLNCGSIRLLSDHVE